MRRSPSDARLVRCLGCLAPDCHAREPLVVVDRAACQRCQGADFRLVRREPGMCLSLPAACPCALFSAYEKSPDRDETTRRQPVVTFEAVHALRRITLNRPKALNSLNDEMVDLIQPQLEVRTPNLRLDERKSGVVLTNGLPCISPFATALCRTLRRATWPTSSSSRETGSTFAREEMSSVRPGFAKGHRLLTHTDLGNFYCYSHHQGTERPQDMAKRD